MRTFFIFFILGLTLAALPNCHDAKGASVTPNLKERCDKSLSCNWCDRNHLSFEFLCCEDGSGWVSAHTIAPFIVFMYTQNVEWTILIFLIFEVAEQIYFTFASNVADYSVTETMFGSLIGDALLQGGTGLWLSVMVCYVFDLPVLISTSFRMHFFNKRWKRYKYFLFFLLHMVSMQCYAWTQGDLNTGLFLHMAIQALLFWVLFPWVLYTAKENDMIWGLDPTNPNATAYSKMNRIGFFYVSGLIVLLIDAANAKSGIMANDWFQAWVVEAAIATVLTIISCVYANQRKDWYMMAIFISTWVAVVGVAFWISGKVVDDNDLLYVAAGFLTVAVLGFFFNEIFQRRKEPYNVNWLRRIEKKEKSKTVGGIPLTNYFLLK